MDPECHQVRDYVDRRLDVIDAPPGRPVRETRRISTVGDGKLTSWWRGTFQFASEFLSSRVASTANADRPSAPDASRSRPEAFRSRAISGWFQSRCRAANGAP